MIVNAKPMRRIRFWRHNCRLGNIACVSRGAVPRYRPRSIIMRIRGYQGGWGVYYRLLTWWTMPWLLLQSRQQDDFLVVRRRAIFEMEPTPFSPATGKDLSEKPKERSAERDSTNSYRNMTAQKYHDVNECSWCYQCYHQVSHSSWCL